MTNLHNFNLELGRCVYPVEAKPQVVKEERVVIQDQGLSIHAGQLIRYDDGHYLATSPHEPINRVAEEGGMMFTSYGSAKWYLELCAMTRKRNA